MSELAWPAVVLLAVWVVSRAAVKAVAVQNGQTLEDSKATKALQQEQANRLANLEARLAVVQAQTTSHALALGFKSPGSQL